MKKREVKKLRLFRETLRELKDPGKAQGGEVLVGTSNQTEICRFCVDTATFVEKTA